MNFQTIWIPKGIWAKFLTEKAGLGKHSYLKYALSSLLDIKDDKELWNGNIFYFWETLATLKLISIRFLLNRMFIPNLTSSFPLLDEVSQGLSQKISGPTYPLMIAVDRAQRQSRL